MESSHGTGRREINLLNSLFSEQFRLTNQEGYFLKDPGINIRFSSLTFKSIAMKKIFIGLLIIAAGTAAYFLYFKKKKDQAVTTIINKEWIIGKWKTLSVNPVKDTAQPLFQYEFLKDGIAYRSTGDSIKADTVSYAWSKDNQLLIKEQGSDSTGVLLTVAALSADSLRVKTNDKTEILFTKLK